MCPEMIGMLSPFSYITSDDSYEEKSNGSFGKMKEKNRGGRREYRNQKKYEA